MRSVERPKLRLTATTYFGLASGLYSLHLETYGRLLSRVFADEGRNVHQQAFQCSVKVDHCGPVNVSFALCGNKRRLVPLLCTIVLCCLPTLYYRLTAGIWLAVLEALFSRHPPRCPTLKGLHRAACLPGNGNQHAIRRKTPFSSFGCRTPPFSS